MLCGLSIEEAWGLMREVEKDVGGRPRHLGPVLHLRISEDTKARIDALRGDAKIVDFVREIIEASLTSRERSIRRARQKASENARRENEGDVEK